MRQTALSVLISVSVCLVTGPLIAQTSHSATGNEPAKGITASQTWDELSAGNQRFVTGKQRHENYVDQRKQLAKTQHPRVAVLSCSDSRVPPEIVFDQGLGDLFVVRGAGNSADPIAIGSLEYAVEHLGTTMIVVLGHQSCGAVTAACSGEKMPSPGLDAVVAPVAESCKVAKQQSDKASLVDFAVRDHVHRTAEALLAQSAILMRAHEEGKLTIVEAYYGLDTGEVTKLH
jgi:carbonic anhydrase